MFSLLSKRNRQREFLELWQPLFEQAKTSMPQHLPVLPKALRRMFIDQWNKTYESADDAGKTGLAVLAYRLDIHRFATGMLLHRRADVRLAGVKILGYMRDETAWPLLTALLTQRNPQVSLAAFAALFSINSRRAIDDLAPIIFQRTDWPGENICQILKGVKELPLFENLKQQLSAHATTHPERAQNILRGLAY